MTAALAPTAWPTGQASGEAVVHAPVVVDV
jgi:hypothetical protein